MINLRLVAAAAALGVAFGSGWLANGWRKDTEISSLTAVHAGLVSAANAATVAAVQFEATRRAKLAEDYAAIDDQRTKELSNANKELERLRSGVADGSIGLRVNATCAARPRDVQATTGTAGMGDAAGPELTTDARQNYFTLQQGIIEVTKQLEAAQDILRRQQAQ